MAVSLSGALSVVTGASSGIGTATAQLLASRGSHVMLLARDHDRLQLTAEGIRRQGGKADAIWSFTNAGKAKVG